ncbi:DUF2975 domain-containing protein [Tabrizicola sp.]|uniref:DUF2975 domain-containing protein n=1 Tax=Tabrizicola sp. TaxID=2005166 RepID=UPI00286CE427|nr:DUF2975 domain-containing protein [Tabrizicola sp.]
MPDLNRIVTLSSWLYWTAMVLVYLLPLIVIIAVLRGYFDPATMLAQYPVLAADTPVTKVQALLVAAIAVAAVLPMTSAFLAMASLFNRYRRGEILSDGSADDILRIGRAMLLVAAATVLVPTLQVLALSWNAAQKTLQIGLDGGTLGFVLSAGLLTVIGWVMREAARVKAENEGFV